MDTAEMVSDSRPGRDKVELGHGMAWHGIGRPGLTHGGMRQAPQPERVSPSNSETLVHSSPGHGIPHDTRL